jgi:UDP-3-O-[3-hydroxymyristoyl] glucosamine N-acyltransferase
MPPVTLGELARRYGLELVGPDREVCGFALLSSVADCAVELLTFATTEAFAVAFAAGRLGVCITTAEAAVGVPPDRSMLLCSGDPRAAFFELVADTAGAFERLPARRGERVVIAPTAVVHDGVQLGDDCVIEDGVVLMANTRLGERVRVKANAVIGGEGFEVKTIGGRPSIVPHTGGVWIGDDVHIGSQTCVDRGILGTFTVIGDGAKIDNLIHIAHSVVLGEDSIVIACSEVSGSVTAGRGVWIAPSCAINPGVDLGDHCFVGTGSTVVADVPAHALVFGSPAKVKGWVCACRERLPADVAEATCPACGRRYDMSAGRPTPMAGGA